jgi:hypothetical protein
MLAGKKEKNMNGLFIIGIFIFRRSAGVGSL